MLKKLLVAIDGSDNAIRALDFAIDMANHFDSQLILLSVYKHHSYIESSLSLVRSYQHLETPDEALRDFATEIMESAANHARNRGFTRFETRIKRGPTSRTIIEEAKKLQVDTVVMGSRGIGDVSGFLLGSVSHKVAGLAHCTCITVK
jgi:nucleotide-binding universal stress UspA family protein